MENNKWYLKNLHRVLMVEIIASLFVVFPKTIASWLLLPASFTELISHSVFILCSYISLTIITGRWKQAGIAAVISLSLFIPELLLENSPGRLLQFVWFLLYPLPIFVFIALQPGPKKNLWLIYPLGFLIQAPFYLSSLVTNWFIRSVSFSGSYYDLGINLLHMTFIVAAMITSFLFICELINYSRGKAILFKTRLLNIGNECKKTDGIIVCCSVNTMLLITITGSIEFLQMTGRTGSSGVITYQRIIEAIDIFSFLAVAIILIWYLGKFLLEYFIIYNIRSRFLYWFSLLPVLGPLSFALLQTHTVKQYLYSERTDTINGLAGSSNISITIISFIFLVVHTLFLITSGNILLIIAQLTCIAIFTWMILNKAGYYTGMVLYLFLLVICIVLTITHKWTGENTGLLYATCIINMVQLALLYPVYHFEQLKYIPAENPGPEKPREEHLFG